MQPHATTPASSQHRATVRRLLVAVFAAGALSGAPRASHAQRVEPGLRGVEVQWAAGAPRVTLGYHDLFDAETVARMGSGLEVTVVMRAWAFPEGSGDPVGFAARSCRVAYDVWEDHYRVEVLDPAGLRTVALPNAQAVMRQCGEVQELPLRMSRPLRVAERYHVATVAEVDPLTPDMVARIQRWVARPGEATQAPDESGGSFFGNFVALFVSPNVGEAERTMRVDSGPQVAP